MGKGPLGNLNVMAVQKLRFTNTQQGAVWDLNLTYHIQEKQMLDALKEKQRWRLKGT